jgi:hypothetical protein
MKNKSAALLGLILCAMIFLPFSVQSSSRQRDKIIIGNDLVAFGSFLTGEYYDLLSKSHFYLGYLSAESSYFNDSNDLDKLKVKRTGCTRSHDALWKISDKKIFLIDLKECHADFTLNSNNNKMIFASWVDGEFFVQSNNLTKQIKCILESKGTGKFRAINQEFYYLKIIKGDVVERRTIFRNIEGYSHAYGVLFEECEPSLRR